METYQIFIIIIGIYLMFKLTENYVNFVELNGFDGIWGDYDEPKIKNFKSKKDTKLEGYCDEKRGVCYKY